MKIIERYIFRKVFVSSAATFVAIVAIIWVIESLRRFNLVTDSGQTFLSFLKLATLLIPPILPLVIPLALLLGVTNALDRLNQESELAIVKASGGLKRLIVKPVLLLAVLCSIASILVTHAIEPQARQTVREMVASVRGDFLSSLIREGNFAALDKGLVAHISERLPDGRIGGLFISDRRDETVEMIYNAREAQVIEAMDQSFLHLIDGEVHQKNADSGAISVIDFESYALDLSEFARQSGSVHFYPKDHSTAYLFSPDPDEPEFQRVPQTYYGELHKRLTGWTTVIVFSLIGIWIAGEARNTRSADYTTQFSAVAVGFGYYILLFFAQDAATLTRPASLFLYILPATAILLLTALIVRDGHGRLPAPLANWFSAAARMLRTLTWPVESLARQIFKVPAR